MNIAGWLKRLGLERYEQAFSANDIDAALLETLTDEDLERLGVTSLGHRKILLNEIKKLKVLSNPTEPETAPHMTAERRQLTVFFCDLVGSTDLSTKLDPEDLLDVLRAYQNAVVGEVARFEGYTSRIIGDGVLAYFGWPRAHEDAVEHAVLAGISVVDAVARLQANERPLACRVGIATGLVIVGDLVGEGSAREEDVVGVTPNLAARLQEVAAPGQVVISEKTRELLGLGFIVRNLGLATIQGFDEPVPAFLVEGQRTGFDRFEERSRGEITPIVGRDQELALLIDRWHQAAAGHGQIILLVGEAGIGKSRLTRALLDAISGEPHTKLLYQSSPYHTDSALWPIIQQLMHAAGFAAKEATGTKLDKLEALLAVAVDDVRDDAPLVAAMLGVDGDQRYGELQLAPHVQRTRTIEALVRQLIGISRKNPAVIVIEDIHWVDPTTLELISCALNAVGSNRILVILTSRANSPPEITARPDLTTQLTLSRLSRAAIEAMVEPIGGGRLSHQSINTIVERTDGVPLFVEEFTKAIVEGGDLSVPASLYDLLMARLDRLGSTKEVAQICAVIGRDFSFDLLSAVASMPSHQISKALEQLVDSELIFRRGTPSQDSYKFKHVLVQDAAYGSLLHSKRASIHNRVAMVLQDRFSADIENQPELLAYHLTAAGSTEKAIAFWLKAGRQAIRRSANLEAISHLTNGLALVETQATSSERTQNELRFQLSLGRVFLKTRGYAASDVEQAYTRARALCRQVGETPELHQSLMGLEAYYFVRAELATAHELAKQSLKLAKRFREPALLLNSYQQMGLTLFHAGKLWSAMPYLQRAMELYDKHRHKVGESPQGLHNPGVGCQCYAALTLWHLGYPDQATKIQADVLTWSHELAQPFNLAYTLCFSSWFSQYCQKVQMVSDLAESAIDLSFQHGFQFWLAIAKCFRGWARAYKDQGEEGIAQLQQSIAAYQATGAILGVSHWTGLLADAFRRSGEPRKGLKVIIDALQAVERTGGKYYEPELLRLRGVLLLDLTPEDPSNAEPCFHMAMRSARSQHAKMSELRAANHIIRLWRDQGKDDDARSLLTPLYDSFTEGFDTPDLLEARQLLEEMS